MNLYVRIEGSYCDTASTALIICWLVTNSVHIYSVGRRRNTIKVAAQETYFQHHSVNVHKIVFSTENAWELVFDTNALKHSRRRGVRRKDEGMVDTEQRYAKDK